MEMAHKQLSAGGLEYAKRVLHNAVRPGSREEHRRASGAQPGRRHPGRFRRCRRRTRSRWPSSSKASIRRRSLWCCRTSTAGAAAGDADGSCRPKSGPTFRCAWPKLEQISPDVVRRIAEILEQRLTSLGQVTRAVFRRRAGGGRDVQPSRSQLGTGAARADRGKRRRARAVDPQFDVRLRGHAADRHLRHAGGAVEGSDKKVLTVALKGTSEKLQEHFFNNMSERGANMLREDMEALGPVKILRGRNRATRDHRRGAATRGGGGLESEGCCGRAIRCLDCCGASKERRLEPWRIEQAGVAPPQGVRLLELAEASAAGRHRASADSPFAGGARSRCRAPGGVRRGPGARPRGGPARGRRRAGAKASLSSNRRSVKCLAISGVCAKKPSARWSSWRSPWRDASFGGRSRLTPTVAVGIVRACLDECAESETERIVVNPPRSRARAKPRRRLGRAWSGRTRSPRAAQCSRPKQGRFDARIEAQLEEIETGAGRPMSGGQEDSPAAGAARQGAASRVAADDPGDGRSRRLRGAAAGIAGAGGVAGRPVPHRFRGRRDCARR